MKPRIIRRDSDTMCGLREGHDTLQNSFNHLEHVHILWMLDVTCWNTGVDRV